LILGQFVDSRQGESEHSARWQTTTKKQNENNLPSLHGNQRGLYPDWLRQSR
jgi:hypothetical protein